jgi:hypothetical protein
MATSGLSPSSVRLLHALLPLPAAVLPNTIQLVYFFQNLDLPISTANVNFITTGLIMPGDHELFKFDFLKETALYLCSPFLVFQ